MASLSSIVKELTGGLSDRQKDVLNKRFCLDDKVKEGATLAELGGSYGVTRERIRQIEAGSLAETRKKLAGSVAAKSALAAIHKVCARMSGTVREDALLAALKSECGLSLRSPQIHFILEAEGKLNFYPEDKDFFSFWYEGHDTLSRAKEVIQKTHSSFTGRKHELLRDGSKAHSRLEEEERAYLALSKKFGTNVYGDFGLTEWPEINPKTIRDRAYLVLKKAERPVHFREIAKLIDARKFDAKAVYASTVHNELIKDRRFVLVGRGVYGLSEAGYRSGTTRDIIAHILKANGPLSADAVVKLVSGERQFKENTILLNLQNRKHFKRLEDGRYDSHEA